jgi:hypothetical protein
MSVPILMILLTIPITAFLNFIFTGPCLADRSGGGAGDDRTSGDSLPGNEPSVPSVDMKRNVGDKLLRFVGRKHPGALLALFGVDRDEAETAVSVSSNFLAIRLKEYTADNVFHLANDYIVIVEYQSTSSEDDVTRFFKYATRRSWNGSGTTAAPPGR